MTLDSYIKFLTASLDKIPEQTTSVASASVEIKLSNDAVINLNYNQGEENPDE